MRKAKNRQPASWVSIVCAKMFFMGFNVGRSKKWLCLLALVVVAPAPVSRAADLAGRYVMATSSAADQEVYGGAVSVLARRNAYEMDWQLAGSRSLHGLGLLEDRDLLGVSVSTGGGAYGIAVYRHGKNDPQWKGRWVTSIDGAANVGEISFDAGSTLVGTHALTCKRPGVGSFVGTVQIEAKGGDNYLLTFLLGHAVLYKGLGVLSGDGRLVVGWSFGSSPALAVYRYNSEGTLTGRRLSLKSGGQVTSTSERMAREGEIAARLLPVAAHGNLEEQFAAGPLPGAFGTLTDPVLAVLEPNPPLVKQMTYDQLQKAGPDGWAERWLNGQLGPEDRADLASARQRLADTGRGKGKNAAAGSSSKTIGELIDAERQRRAEKKGRR